MIDTMTEYGANILGTMLRNKIRTVVRGLQTGKTSLINAGSNNVITFPLIASEDIPKDIAEDIGKDVETVLALATKNFIEGDISRGADELSMDAIMASLPITRLNSSIADGTGETAIAIGAMLPSADSDAYSVYEECITRANEKLLAMGSEKFRTYAEAQGIEIFREKGSYATFITVQIPYITGKQEVKNVQVQLGFESVIRFVPVADLVTRIGSFDSNRFYKSFVRLSKGEIAFMSDFLLEMDRLKVEAKSTATSNYLWRNLEMMNRKRDIFVNSYPFSTFVISDLVADEIKTKFAIDTNNDRHIKSIMQSFFAFAYYEVNTGTNVIKVMRDGDNMSKKTTVDDIVRNTTKVERKLKELIKIGG